MSDIAIRVEGLGKRYRIGERERYRALRDVITDGVASPFRKLRNAVSGRREAASNGNGHSLTSDLRPPTSDKDSSLVANDSSLPSQHPTPDTQPPDTFWALKDVSFEVKRGEVVGIIGRNGAGKSTLLKILSRITAPTTGEVEIKGRVGSLLEVGTGFHPELTGRENIYLNGAILGMKRAEINRKFDEMVAFAEIEKFIDTPVKRYSSGMYVRLAFAVAAHLDPEILLVDEVLAVGDAQFQKKCLGKMGDVAREGRTVLFVSHNIGAIGNLCSSALLLHEGQLDDVADCTSIIEKYLRHGIEQVTMVPLADRPDRKGDGRIRFVGFHLEDDFGSKIRVLQSGGDFHLILSYECPDCLGKRNVTASFAVKDSSGVFVLHHRTDFSNQSFGAIPARGQFICRIPKLPLAPGEYWLNIYAGINDQVSDLVEDAVSLTVEAGDFFGTGHQGWPMLCRVLSEGDWRLRP